MARYRHYGPQQTKMIAVPYGRQLLPGTFEHALSYLINNEIDLGRFAARFRPPRKRQRPNNGGFGLSQRGCRSARYWSPSPKNMRASSG